MSGAERFCPQCGQANAAAGSNPQAPQFDLNKVAAQSQQIAGQAEQLAGQAGQLLQGAQAKLAQQSFIQQAAARVDQIVVPGLHASHGTTTRDYIWSAVALLVTLLGVWKASIILLVITLAVGATAVFLGIRTGVSPALRALAFTLAGGLVAFAFPADPIQLTAIVLSMRGAWGIVKELFPAEGPHLTGNRAMYLWGGMALAAVGMCFQWTKRSSSFWSNYNFADNSITYSFSYWGGESAKSYLIFLIGLALVLYFTQGKRWTFAWQVGLTVLVWPLAIIWAQGFTSYLGIGLLLYTIGIAVALRGLLGDRVPWAKWLK